MYQCSEYINYITEGVVTMAANLIAAPAPGNRRFTDVKLLGTGSYGEVYGAYDSNFKTKVAIKVSTLNKGLKTNI
jgi:hypothetical protein